MRLVYQVRIYRDERMIAHREYSNQDQAIRDGMLFTERMMRTSPVLHGDHTVTLHNLEQDKQVQRWDYNCKTGRWMVRATFTPITLFTHP